MEAGVCRHLRWFPEAVDVLSFSRSYEKFWLQDLKNLKLLMRRVPNKMQPDVWVEFVMRATVPCRCCCLISLKNIIFNKV